MKVKVGDRWYDYADQPLAVELTPQDRINIMSMPPDATRYGVFADNDWTKEQKLAWLNAGGHPTAYRVWDTIRNGFIGPECPTADEAAAHMPQKNLDNRYHVIQTVGGNQLFGVWDREQLDWVYTDITRREFNSYQDAAYGALNLLNSMVVNPGGLPRYEARPIL